MITSLKMALRSIGSSKMRSLLTMLGIIIGVMALVVLVSLVNGATDSVMNAVSDLGSSMITVTVTDDKGKPLSLQTMEEWMADEQLGLLAPYQSTSVVGRHYAEYGSVTIYGTTPAYYDIQAYQLSMGRWLKDTDIENSSYVCVLNEAAAEDLIGYLDCVGQTLILNGAEFTVVGVLKENEDSLNSLLSLGSMIAYVPWSTAIRITDTLGSDVTSFYVSAPIGGTMKTTEQRLEELLLDRFDEDEDAYIISTTDMLEDAMDSVTSVLSVLLGGIAAISLVVGGIGIMNIMMVTVTERTREIGIRKAIGASRATILTQFLMEAVVLCMMGCALGIFISWAILQVVSTVVAGTGLVFTLDGGIVLIAVIFCFFIGVAFGLYPANKAAKMKPIDALHYGG